VAALRSSRSLPVIAVNDGDASRGRFGFRIGRIGRGITSVIRATRQIVRKRVDRDGSLKSLAMGESKKHRADMEVK
jgi:hypothetical protein